MEYIVERDMTSITAAQKDPKFRGIIVRCRNCIYYQKNPEYPTQGICCRRANEPTKRNDYCSRGKLDTGRTPETMR